MATALPLTDLDLANISAAIRRAQRPTVWRVPRYNGKWVLRRTVLENFLSCAVWSDSRSEDSAFGIWMHEAFAAYTRVCQAHRQESRLSDTERIARDTFHSQPRGLAPARLREGIALLDQWARQNLAELDTLTRLEFTMAHDVGPWIITGQADREDRLDDDDRADPPRSIRLTDEKTHWAVADHSFQMQVYAYLRWQEAIREARALGLRRCPLEEVQVRIRHPRLPWAPPTEDTYELPYLEEFWQDEVMEPLRRMWPQRRSLGPTGGSACQYCAKRLTCASTTGAAAHAPGTMEEFLPYFQTALRAEAQLRELRAGIKQFFRNRAHIEVLGHEVGPLLPRTSEEARVVDGRDEELIEAMNAISPGAGDLARRTGVHPGLIDPAWWSTLVEMGLLEIAPKKATVKWRKVVRRGPQTDEGEDLGDPSEALWAGAPDSVVTVLDGGLT